MLYKKLFPSLSESRWTEINLDQLARQLITKCDGDSPALDPEWCAKQQRTVHKMLEVDYSWGGYLEDRSFLLRGHNHRSGHLTHRGIDYHVPVDTAVRLPENGELLCLEKDPHAGGWGGRAVYRIGDVFAIFAHLYGLSYPVGKSYDKGSIIGLVAPPANNGGWAPHLHVQCMRKYDLMADGYGPLLETTASDYPNPNEVL